ncbi:MAG: hypothetical protein JOZ83_14580 [Silvibacterium sp.]|nr:hypothetical protein [Silvibacterium sp.]
MPEKKSSGKKNFDAQLASIEALRDHPDEACVAPLRAALKHQNNYVVSKAADMAAQRRLEPLLSDLVAAFDRFFEDPAKRDPQCWAKNSISRALAALELQDPKPFLRGLKHIQLEPTWGGSSDSAGPLRGTCALALVQCRSVPETGLLRHLIDVLVDSDKTARNDAVRALEQLGSPAAALLLRLRAQLGDDEPEITGACYAAVLSIEGVAALPWAARFLAGENDASGEAALAIAATHSPEAFELLKSRLDHARDPWFKSVLLSAIALTRQSDATEFLLAMIRSDSLGADLAVEALVRSAPSDEVMQQLKALVSGNTRLEHAFAGNTTARR